MSKNAAILLVLAGAAAPGAALKFGLGDTALLAGYVFALLLAVVICRRPADTEPDDWHEDAPPTHTTIPTTRLVWPAGTEPAVWMTERLENEA